jgi:hypothetical protein
MLKAMTLPICAAFLPRATCHASELTENTAFVPTPTPNFDALRINGLEALLANLSAGLKGLLSIVKPVSPGRPDAPYSNSNATTMNGVCHFFMIG